MARFEHIQAVTFDVGGTLIKPWPSVGHVYAEIAAKHGETKASPDVLNRQFSTAWKKLRNFNHGRDEWAALVDQTFAGVCTEPPSRTFFPEVYDSFREARAWHIFDDVLPALDALAALDVNLGIISNWDDRLKPLLEELRLSKYFEAIIVSHDVGFSKPSPVIFEHACRKLGVAPEFILHVGDSPESDIAGAKSAGYASLLLDRDSAGPGPGCISSLKNLEELLGQPRS